MTNSAYLEVTFRKGKPFAAYFYLPRRPGDNSARTERRQDGMLIDFAADGRPIGIEFTAPSRVTLGALNEVLQAIHQQPATGDDLAPLMTGA
jgi:hypothetical protein